MQGSKSLLVLLCITTTFLFARDLSLQRLVNDVKEIKKYQNQDATIALSLRKWKHFNKNSRSIPSGNSTIEVYVDLPQGDGPHGQRADVYLFDNYGTIIEKKTITKASQMSFAGVWPGKYTLYAKGYFSKENITTHVIGVYGTSDTLLSSAEYLNVEENITSTFNNLSFQSLPQKEEIKRDTIILKGKVLINGEDIGESASGSIAYYTNKFYHEEYADFITDTSGSFITPITVSGDSLIACVYNITSMSGKKYESCWINGENINDNPTIHTFSNGDTVTCILDLQSGAILSGECTYTYNSSEDSISLNVGFINENGYYIHSNDLSIASGEKKEFTFESIPKGNYYVFWESKHLNDRFCYYPGTSSPYEAELVTISGNGAHSITIDLGTISDTKEVQKSVVNFEATVLDEDGDVVNPEKYTVKAYGSYDELTLFNSLDSKTKGSINGVDSITLFIEGQNNRYLGQAWYGGSTISNATLITPESDTENIKIEVTLPLGGALKGVVQDSDGKSLDQLSFKIASPYDKFSSAGLHHEIFTENRVGDKDLWLSNGYTISGIPSGDNIVRVLPCLNRYEAHTDNFEYLEMFQGGRNINVVQIEKLQTLEQDIVRPIVSGRLDTKLEIKYEVAPYAYITLVDNEGYPVSFGESNDSYEHALKKSKDSYVSNVLEPFVPLLYKISETYKYELPISLVGIGQGEYYLASFTTDGESINMKWYGKEETHKIDIASFIDFPYSKLSIPQGAKTIKFETDSTWIKDFQWDITPITNLKAITKKEFSANVIGKNVQIQLPKEMKKASVKLFSTNGRLIKTSSISKGGIHNWNISDLAKGMYLLKVQSDGMSFSEQIVVK